MSPRDDGGQLFPVLAVSQNAATGETTMYQSEPGATIRDYYIAHAPAEPWPEFEPVMPPRPVLPNKHTMLSDEDRRDWDNDRLDYDEEGCSEALRQFAAAHRAALAAQDEWGATRNLQRRIQWPAYWADQMLKARTA